VTLGRHVLVIEDDPTIRSALTLLLTAHGYRVTGRADDRGIEQVVGADPPDLAILDRSLPSGDGMELTKWLRDTLDIPIVILTAAGDASDRLAGHAAGADRYIVKPYDSLEVVLAVGSLLRRSGPRTEMVLGDLTVDEAAHRASRAGAVLDLPPKQFAILVQLARRAGHVVTKDELLAAVWGAGYHDGNLVEVQVGGLRRRLHDAGPPILTTVRGAGYRLDPR
jgi:two-component system, OmpR family, response regulator